MSSGELGHTLLPKTIALPVFSSDALSSVAYATQEILLVLGLVGVSALGHVVPISVAVSTLLAVVVISYRQTVRAYPTGGGAYRVAHDNLGRYPGILAASALLIDYVLTVAVSIVAGTDAIVSAIPSLDHLRVEVAIGFVLLVALANLRGVKESGVIFAIPTYGFVLCIYALLLSGFVKCLGGCPLAASHNLPLHPEVAGLSLFLVLRAFAAGTTALTGVEAISDGVPAFRYPQSRNAATTLAIMGSISITMFLGISWLAAHTQVHFIEGADRTVVAQIAQAIFGDGLMFYITQVATTAILVLAANTAYQDFPRLSSILAGDRFMPRQFMNRGDRLVFSNGIVILSALASLLIIAFDAELNRLIQLYLVGVFISFTLSQTGMVLHWKNGRERNWARSAVINGIGATCTGIVLVVVIITKFAHGAWIVLAAIPVLMFMMHSIHKHYTALARQLEHPERRPADRRPQHQNVVLLVRRVDAATARAVGIIRSVRPASAVAIATDHALHAPWKRLAPEIPIETLPTRGSESAALRGRLREIREGLSDEDFLTVAIPEILRSRSTFEIFRRPGIHRLKASLLGVRGVQVMDIPMISSEVDPTIDQAVEPSRNYAVILVGGVHNATLQAIEYAETLRPTDIRAVSFGLDPEATRKLGDQWLGAQIPIPLEIEDSPFRDIGSSLVSYMKQFNADGIHRMVTLVLPEFVVSKARHQLLHGQTALLVKRRMLFESGVVVVSVPYYIEEE